MTRGMEVTHEVTHDFGDGAGPVPAHRHVNRNGRLGGWVADTAYVGPSCEVRERALVYGRARVLRRARITGDARVFDDAVVTDDARVATRAWVHGNARVSGDGHVGGYAEVTGDARIRGVVLDRYISEGRVRRGVVLIGSTVLHNPNRR